MREQKKRIQKLSKNKYAACIRMKPRKKRGEQQKKRGGTEERRKGGEK